MWRNRHQPSRVKNFQTSTCTLQASNGEEQVILDNVSEKSTAGNVWVETNG